MAAHVEAPAPPHVEVERVVSTADLAAAMEVAAKGADVVVMAAAPADFTPVRDQPDQDQEVRQGRAGRRPGADARRARRPGRRPHRPAPGARRVRRRDPRCRPEPGRARAGQAGAQGLRPAGAERGRPRQGVRPAGQRDHRSRRSRAGGAAGRQQRPAGPPYLGRGAGRPLTGGNFSLPGTGREQRKTTRHGRQTVHLRIGDRRASGQDRRPDQRLGPGRDARQRSAEPGRGGVAGHHRAGRGGRRGDHRGVRRDPQDRPAAGGRDRLRLLEQGLRRHLLRRDGGDRAAVAGHRPGRGHRVRAPHR